jgi:uncharacterized protein (TIGR03086 family)
MDMLEMYERALQRTAKIVAGTRVDQFGDPTPCDDWDVKKLLDHIIGGCLMFASGADGRRDDAIDGRHVRDGNHVDLYRHASRAALESFRAPGALERSFKLPWGDTPGSAALGLALTDAAVHGWDLAKATGQDAQIDDDIAEALYSMTTSMMAPKGRYPRGEAFQDPVEVSDGAPSAERLLAYLGRRSR